MVKLFFVAGQWDEIPKQRFEPLAFRVRFLFISAAAVAVISQLAIVRAVIMGRAPASSPGRGARLAEIAWVVLPAIALIAVLVLTWNRIGAPVALSPVNGIVV